MHWRRKWQPTPVFLPGESRDGGAWRAAIYGVAQSWTRLSDFTFMHGRRQWQPTPVCLPGESRDGGAWWAAVSGVTQSWTRLKRLSSSSRVNDIEHLLMCLLAIVYLFLFFFGHIIWQVGKQNLSPVTRDQTQAPAVKVLSPYHWTAREFPPPPFFF